LTNAYELLRVVERSSIDARCSKIGVTENCTNTDHGCRNAF